MSFYTALQFYRPTPAPKIAASDLAAAVEALQGTGLLAPSGSFSIQMKFGASVDCDDKDTIWEEEVAPGVYASHDIEWDVANSELKSLDEVIEIARRSTDGIYRATLFLGKPAKEVLADITRAGSPENAVDFCPDTISLEVGPVRAGLLDTEELHRVGWITLSLSGRGYLFPWSLADAVQRCEQSQPIRKLTHPIRALWPVTPSLPGLETIDLRKRSPHWWAYPDCERAWDWYWCALET